MRCSHFNSHFNFQNSHSFGETCNMMCKVQHHVITNITTIFIQVYRHQLHLSNPSNKKKELSSSLTMFRRKKQSNGDLSSPPPLIELQDNIAALNDLLSETKVRVQVTGRKPNDCTKYIKLDIDTEDRMVELIRRIACNTHLLI